MKSLFLLFGFFIPLCVHTDYEYMWVAPEPYYDDVTPVVGAITIGYLINVLLPPDITVTKAINAIFRGLYLIVPTVSLGCFILDSTLYRNIYTSADRSLDLSNFCFGVELLLLYELGKDLGKFTRGKIKERITKKSEPSLCIQSE